MSAKIFSAYRASAGSVVRAVARCAEKVAPALDRIAGVLGEANQLHADETGVRCAGRTQWIHVASTATHTLSPIPNAAAKASKSEKCYRHSAATPLPTFGVHTILSSNAITPAAMPTYCENLPNTSTGSYSFA